MSIIFNSPHHVNERANVEPLQLHQIEHAVKVLNEVCNIANVDGGTIALGYVQALIWEYENLKHAALTQPKWISVNDALPEHGKRVLVHSIFAYSAWYYDGNFYITLMDRINDKRLQACTHWQPLPNPPKTI